MSEGPKMPSDEELEKTLSAMDAAVGGPMLDPKKAPLRQPPEQVGRIRLLEAIRDAVGEKSEAAKLAGFLFVSVCDDGVTPVLYSIQTMTGTAVRLLLAEIGLLQARIQRELNRAEDYYPENDPFRGLEAVDEEEPTNPDF